VINIVAATNNTGGGTASLSSNVSFSNANGLTFYTSAGGAVVGSYSVPTQSVQPVAFSASGGSSAFSTLSFVSGSNVNWTNSNGGVQMLHSLAGTSTGSAGANVGISMTHNSSGLNLSITTPTQSVQPVAWSGSGGSSNFSTLNFSNASNISFSNSNGSIQVIHNLAGTSTGSAGANVGISMTHNSSGLNLSITTPAQTNQTGNFYVTANSTQLSSTAGIDLRSLSFAGAGNISVGVSQGVVVISQTGGAGGGAAISAGANSQNTGTVNFANSNGITFGLSNNGTMTASHNGLTSQSNQAVSNSAGSFTFQTLNFSNANNVTFGTSAGGIITASVAAPGAAAENNWMTLLGANVSGSSSASGSTIGLSGVNMTLSGTNNSQIVFSVPATSSLVGVNGVSISTNGSTISLSGVPTYTALSYQNRQLGASTALVPGQNNVWVIPMRIVVPVNASTLLQMVSLNMTTTTATASQSGNWRATHQMALYLANATNGNQFDTIWKTAVSLSCSQSSNAGLSFTVDGGTGGQQFTTNSAASNLNTQISGIRDLTFIIGSTLNPGLYAFGFVISTTLTGGSQVMRSYAPVIDSPMPSGQGLWFGAATNASVGYADGGTIGTTSNAMPDSFNVTDIKQVSNQAVFVKIGAI
jgi:hypothetical protein